MVRRKLYMALGGLDPQFFAHMEEIDLCWRIRLAGFSIAVVPAASVRHLGGGSLEAGNPRKVYLNFRNNLLMMHKNLPDSVRGRLLLRRRLLDALAWAKMVAGGDFKGAAAIVRAHRDFRRMRRLYASHPDENLIGADAGSRRSILWQHFARRRTRFSELT